MATKPKDLDLGKGYRYGWHDESVSVNEPKRGLSREVVEDISRGKGEPEWMTRFRLKSYEYFAKRPMPGWGADLNEAVARKHVWEPGRLPGYSDAEMYRR